MIINKNRLLKTLSVILAVIITSFILPPRVVQAYGEINYPDFERLGSGISGFPLPLVDNPMIKQSRTDLGFWPEKSITFDYSRGTDSSLQEISLDIKWHYDRHDSLGQPLTHKIRRLLSFGIGDYWVSVEKHIGLFLKLSQDPDIRILIAEPDLSHPASYVEMESHLLAYYQKA